MHGTSRDPYSQSSGRATRLQSGTDDWGNSKSRPLDEWGFAQPQNISKNSYSILSCTFYLCLSTSHPLKTLRITENNTQLFVCNETASLICSIFKEMIAGSVFMLLTAGPFAAAIRRKCDSDRDVAFFGRRVTASSEKEKKWNSNSSRCPREKT